MGRRIQISHGDASSPRTSHTVEHEQAFDHVEAMALVGALRDGIKTRFGIADEERTPYWCEEGEGDDIETLERPTARDRLCALVDALNELQPDIAEGGTLSLTLVVRR